VSLSRATYERLKAFCELNDVSMSEFVETRIGDFLGRSRRTAAPDETERKVADRIFTF